MRWVLGLVPFAVMAACGGLIGTSSDAGVDGHTNGACSSDSDCAKGYVCLYPANGGCAATKQCMPHVMCKGAPSCACDGTDVVACGGSPKPILHAGSCNPDVFEPPPCGNSVACEVCDVSGYSPAPQTKPIAASGACSSGDIAAFVTACLSSKATSTTCQAWETSDAGACTGCVLTPSTNASWGPFVCESAGCSLNRGGCIDVTLGQTSLENSTSTGSCGDFHAAADGCLAYACDTCVTPSDQSSCMKDATANECKAYVDASANAPVCAALDAGAPTCFPQTDSDYAAFVNVFCGTGP